MIPELFYFVHMFCGVVAIDKTAIWFCEFAVYPLWRRLKLNKSLAVILLENAFYLCIWYAVDSFPPR